MSHQEIIKTVESMTRAFHAKDLDAVVAFYEESGASVAFQPGALANSAETIRAGFAEAIAISPFFEYSGHEVIVQGDIALHFAPWKMSGTAPDGSSVSAQGLSVSVLRKQKDASWKLMIDNPYGQSLWEAARIGSAAQLA